MEHLLYLTVFKTLAIANLFLLNENKKNQNLYT